MAAAVGGAGPSAGTANGSAGKAASSGLGGSVAVSGAGGTSAMSIGGDAGDGNANGGSVTGNAGAAGTAGSMMSPTDVSNKYNHAPATRTIKPSVIFKTTGSVVNPKNVLSGEATAIVGKGSSIIFDFGKEVGGIITLGFAAASDTQQSVGLAFNETSTYAGPNSDQSNGSGLPDGAIYGDVAGESTYVLPKKYLRGGFRYLTVFLNSDGWVHLESVSLDFLPDPEAPKILAKFRTSCTRPARSKARRALSAARSKCASVRTDNGAR